MLTATAPNYYMINVADLLPLMDMPNVSSRKVEEFAQAIVKTGGLITPLLVRQVGLQSYQLLNDELQGFEYLAVKRAKELSPRTCEMVNVFVISADAESAAIHQLNLVQGNL